MKPKKQKKLPKEDLIPIALIHLAQESNKSMNRYYDTLVDYMSKGKSKEYKEEVENWLWEIIFEDGTYEELLEHLKKWK